MLDGKEGVVGHGEQLKLPRLQAHTFWNANPEEDLEIRVWLFLPHFQQGQVH